MPKKKKSSAPKGLSPQQVAQANQQGFDHAMNRLPPITFEDMFSNFEMFSGGLGDMFGNVFGGLIDRGENTVGVADRNPTTATEQLTQAVNPQPQMDPYEARIQELMKQRGWTRDAAIANQQNALGLGTDYNKDGAVTNDEWAKYTQTPTGAQYAATHTGQPWRTQQPQPQAPQPGAPQPGMPNGVNLTPEQLAAIQKFNGYGRGVV